MFQYSILLGTIYLYNDYPLINPILYYSKVLTFKLFKALGNVQIFKI